MVTPVGAALFSCTQSPAAPVPTITPAASFTAPSTLAGPTLAGPALAGPALAGVAALDSALIGGGSSSTIDVADPFSNPLPVFAPSSVAQPVAVNAPLPVAGERPLTVVGTGGNEQDAQYVERALEVLRGSASGAQIVDRLLAVNAKINVLSDQEFASLGHDSAHAFYDPAADTMYLRRSNLADDGNVKFAAVALAHEGTHLLDDVSGITEPVTKEIVGKVAAAGGLESSGGIEARDQGLFELKMIKETRAFVFSGAVARELGLDLPNSDPTSVAIAGANDSATFNAVWERLLRSAYNAEQRSAAPRNL